MENAVTWKWQIVWDWWKCLYFAWQYLKHVFRCRWKIWDSVYICTGRLINLPAQHDCHWSSCTACTSRTGPSARRTGVWPGQYRPIGRRWWPWWLTRWGWPSSRRCSILWACLMHWICARLTRLSKRLRSATSSLGAGTRSRSRLSRKTPLKWFN